MIWKATSKPHFGSCRESWKYKVKGWAGRNGNFSWKDRCLTIFPMDSSTGTGSDSALKTRLWLWKPFFCAMTQFDVNNVWSLENTDVGTSKFPHLMRVCHYLHQLSANSNVNYGKLRHRIINYSFYADSDSVNSSYQRKSSGLNF